MTYTKIYNSRNGKDYYFRKTVDKPVILQLGNGDINGRDDFQVANDFVTKPVLIGIVLNDTLYCHGSVFLSDDLVNELKKHYPVEKLSHELRKEINFPNDYY